MERQLVVDAFSNELAMDMGLKVIELAKSKSLNIGVSICRLNHTVFLFMGNGLPADKHNWIERKANVVKHFEESSLAVKEDLASGGMTLSGTFGLDETLYVARGGSIPIVVREVGLVGAITVTGLRDIDDHQLIVDALRDSCDFAS